MNVLIMPSEGPKLHITGESYVHLSLLVGEQKQHLKGLRLIRNKEDSYNEEKFMKF